MRLLGWRLALLITLTASTAGAALAPGDSRRALEHAGLAREYLLHVPPSYTGTTPVPLVLDIHGWTSNATQQRGLSGMIAVSDREGFLLAHPEGVSNRWNAGICCGNPELDDVAFLRAVVAAIVADGAVDESRVYVTGLSNGGAMSHRVACDAGDLFAAAAPLAFPVPASPLSACRPVRPIPVLTFMGLNDVLVPYEGVPFPSAPATFDYWHDVNGCAGTTPDVVVAQGQSRCETYTACSAGVEAGLCSITARTFGGTFFDGHVLYLNDDFVLADLVWGFLSRFRLPDAPASFRRGTLSGTTRLKLRGAAAAAADATWEIGIGAGTWWATDADGRSYAGPTRGKGRRRTLLLTSDAAASFAEAVAARVGVDAAALTFGAEPTFRATLGRRARVTAKLRLAGGASGTFRVKLAGALAP